VCCFFIVRQSIILLDVIILNVLVPILNPDNPANFAMNPVKALNWTALVKNRCRDMHYSDIQCNDNQSKKKKFTTFNNFYPPHYETPPLCLQTG
jgi:hypothetical protein